MIWNSKSISKRKRRITLTTVKDINTLDDSCVRNGRISYKIDIDDALAKHQEHVSYDENANIELEKQIRVLKRRLSQIYDDKLDGILSNDEYFERKEKYQIELDSLEIKRSSLIDENRDFIERCNNFLELCENLYSWYKTRSFEEKRSFLNLIFSNFFGMVKTCI